MQAGERDSGVRLAELVAAFSLAIDLGLGQPMEHVLRSWLIATRLGHHVGLDPEERGALYYVVTLAWAGCVADTPVLAALVGDDIAYRADTFRSDLRDLPALGFMLQHLGAGQPALHRLRLAVNLIATGGKAVEQAIRSHCLVTGNMADRIGLGSEVSGPLQQVFTRWDGKGVPKGVGGEAIALKTRLYHLADVVEVFHRSGGATAAVDVVRSRRGTQFDPAVADLFCSVAPDVLRDPATEDDWNEVIAGDPALQRCLTEGEFDQALEAIADFTDLRSPSRAGHSRNVAELASQAALRAGLPAAEVVAVRRAGLLHDMGLHGISASILDKAGPLSPSEWERMRMHSYYTERMLARPPKLARLGAIASLTHERCDGSGYHRRLTAPAIPVSGRLLAAACAFCAMTEPRSYRPALSAKQATAELRADARRGKLDAAAVDAVLAAAGQSQGKRRSGPAGLTPREVEVLILIARGASNRQVAGTLHIAPKTAGTYIERIYSKAGVSTRSTATLFAMHHGLLDTLEPLDL
ncbi:MAG TPA: HD domain-containing phosphohydrolase [Candidatus Micrarchaeaceae archaeon]|nr:HD domain-containing phosphohydrolase [Candidatus Micrarchaeaceae archaeon]